MPGPQPPAFETAAPEIAGYLLQPNSLTKVKE